MSNIRSKLVAPHSFVTAIFALSLLGAAASAQVVALPRMESHTVAAADNPAMLPDAPTVHAPPSPAPASETTALPLEQQPHPEVTVRLAPVHVVQDLGHILISPVYLRRNDLKWILPLTAAAATAFATDTHTVTQVVSSNPSFDQTSTDVSNGLIWGLIATPATMFGVGEFKHNPHARETGILGSEAIGDAAIVDQLVKLCAWRQRPTMNNGQGEFFIGEAGVSSSFVSGHSMIAWSSAAVIAGEYPSKWVQLGVYAAAAGVSATRVMGQEHFPSDVLLGAAGGWLIGHYVFRAHHHHIASQP